MTIVNHKKDELHIIIETSSPDEEREILMQALVACVRWNAHLEEGVRRTGINEDGQHLIVVSALINNLIISKANNNKQQLDVGIKSTSPAEEREVIMYALAACIRWYGNMKCSDLRTTNNIDGQYLIDISELINNMIPVQTIGE